MEQLKTIKDQLISQVQGQMGNLHKVDAKELGEVVDMIKDIEEAIYYCTVTKAMKDGEEKGKMDNIHYYTEYLPYEKSYKYNPYRDMDINDKKMYYTDNTMSNGGHYGNSGSYYGNNYPTIHDSREGKSSISRKMYMESKELNKDKDTQMKELKRYIKELSEDIQDMLKHSTEEEKMTLKHEISEIANML